MASWLQYKANETESKPEVQNPIESPQITTQRFYKILDEIEEKNVYIIKPIHASPNSDTYLREIYIKKKYNQVYFTENMTITTYVDNHTNKVISYREGNWVFINEFHRKYEVIEKIGSLDEYTREIKRDTIEETITKKEQTDLGI